MKEYSPLCSRLSCTDPLLRYYGKWQKTEEGEIRKYGTISRLAIGFTGPLLEMEGDFDTCTTLALDDAAARIERQPRLLRVHAPEGRHILRAEIRDGQHFALQSCRVPETHSFFAAPRKPFIQFIGDSITCCFPGFSSVTPQLLDAEYAVTAFSGMSLVDGWGWYSIPQGLQIRPGMESMAFLTENVNQTTNYTPYAFQYSESPDALVLFLGTNDYLDSASDRQKGNVTIFAERYARFAERLREKYPNASMVLLNALSDKCCRREGIETACQKMQQSLKDIQLAPSDKWNVEICEDGTHPTEEGYRTLSEKLAAWLREHLPVLSPA